jgi:hypothetical protein
MAAGGQGLEGPSCSKGSSMTVQVLSPSRREAARSSVDLRAPRPL